MPTDCSRFWEEFDANTHPGKLHTRKPPLTKAEAASRRKDVEDFMERIGFRFFNYLVAKATGDTTKATQLETDIQIEVPKQKEGITRLSHIQNDILKKYFPPKNAVDEIDFESFQKCAELFANGDLGDHFMDSRDMWVVWLAFAKAAAQLGITKWKKLELTLLKCALIDYAFPQHRRVSDPTTGQPVIDPKQKLTPLEIDNIRKKIHTGTEADRKRAEEDLGKKLLSYVLPEQTEGTFFALARSHYPLMHVDVPIADPIRSEVINTAGNRSEFSADRFVGTVVRSGVPLAIAEVLAEAVRNALASSSDPRVLTSELRRIAEMARENPFAARVEEVLRRGKGRESGLRHDLVPARPSLHDTPAELAPPCEGAIHDRILGSTTECINHQVVFVETHQWVCPPDGHTETTVYRRHTIDPC